MALAPRALIAGNLTLHNGGTRPLHNYGGAALVAFNRRTYVSCVAVGERDDDKACLRSGASITQAPKADDSKEAVVALLGVDESRDV